MSKGGPLSEKFLIFLNFQKVTKCSKNAYDGLISTTSDPGGVQVVVVGVSEPAKSGVCSSRHQGNLGGGVQGWTLERKNHEFYEIFKTSRNVPKTAMVT